MPSAQASACAASARRIGRRERVEFQRRHVRRAPCAIWNSVAREHEPASTAACPATSRQRAGIVASGQQPGAAEIIRQAHRHARAAGDQRVRRRPPRRSRQVRVRHRVDDRVAAAAVPCSAVIASRIAAAPAATVANGTRPTVPSVWRDSTRTRLASRHRRQRMVLHAALVQQRARRRTDGPDRRCAHWPGTPGRRARSRSRAPPPAHRRPGRYCPASVLSKVEQYLKKNCRQPARCSQSSAARLSRDRLAQPARCATSARRRPRPPRARRRPRGHADDLHRAHAVAHQHGGEVGRTGEVVGDAAQQRAVLALSYASSGGATPMLAGGRQFARQAARRDALDKASACFSPGRQSSAATSRPLRPCPAAAPSKISRRSAFESQRRRPARTSRRLRRDQHRRGPPRHCHRQAARSASATAMPSPHSSSPARTGRRRATAVRARPRPVRRANVTRWASRASAASSASSSAQPDRPASRRWSGASRGRTIARVPAAARRGPCGARACRPRESGRWGRPIQRRAVGRRRCRA